MRLYWLRVALNPMTGVLIRRGVDTGTQGRPCKYRGSGRSNAVISRELSKTARSSQKLRTRG